MKKVARFGRTNCCSAPVRLNIREDVARTFKHQQKRTGLCPFKSLGMQTMKVIPVGLYIEVYDITARAHH